MEKIYVKKYYACITAPQLEINFGVTIEEN